MAARLIWFEGLESVLYHFLNNMEVSETCFNVLKLLMSGLQVLIYCKLGVTLMIELAGPCTE